MGDLLAKAWSSWLNWQNLLQEETVSCKAQSLEALHDCNAAKVEDRTTRPTEDWPWLSRMTAASATDLLSRRCMVAKNCRVS